MEREAILTRDNYAEGATEGMLYLPHVDETFYTLELPWKDNEPRISCIPTGEYYCEKRESPKFGNRYILRGTEPRTYILIHAGNYPRNTYGCILLGTSRGNAEGHPAVWRSKVAIAKFEELMENEPFTLTIQDVA